MTPPDFYLASSEGYGLELPRRCTTVARLRGSMRDDLLLIQIVPSWILEASDARSLGCGAPELDHVVVATRHQEESLFPIRSWPVFVHVARLLVHYHGQTFVADDEIENLAWAELYPSEASARARSM